MMSKTYYKMNLHKFSFSELWRVSANPIVFVILLLVKLLRARVRSEIALATPDQSTMISLEDIHNDSRPAIVERTQEMQSAGFQFMFAQKIAGLGNRRAYSTYFLNSDRSTIADVTHFVMVQNGQRIEREIVLITSKLSNGKILITTNATDCVALGDPFLLQWIKKPDPTALVQSVLQIHRERLARQSATPILIQGRGEFETVATELERQQFQKMIDRKVLLPLTDSDREHIAAIQLPEFSDNPNSTKLVESKPEPESTLGHAEHASEFSSIGAGSEVGVEEEMHPEDRMVLTKVHMAHLDSTAWFSKLFLLVASLVAFAALGAWAWDWKVVALLIPILFVHELGHYIAMRLLHYKNVKMFFLPLFGAAVQGRNYNAPGWQRAVVALAGPIPGIVIGLIVLYFGIANPFWLTVAALTVFINALNLLPFLPLDGGWVMQTTLFCRNQYLDFLFRVFAAIALWCLGFFLGSPLIMVLAALMSLGLGMQWRIGKIAHQLKREKWVPQPTGPDELCEPTIFEIVKRLRTQTHLVPSQRSSTALSVYELLSARPPGLLASAALLGTQLVAFFGSIIVFYLIYKAAFAPINQQPFEFPKPTEIVSVAECQLPKNQGGVMLESESPATVYLKCSDLDTARAAATRYDVDGDYVVSRIGKTVVVEIPNSSSKKMIEVESISERSFTGTYFRQENFNAVFSIRFQTGDQRKAERLASLIDHHCFCSEFDVGAPWHPKFELNEKYRHAQKTYHDLQMLEFKIDEEISSDGELDDLDNLGEEWGFADEDKAKELIQKLAERINKKRIQEYQRYQDENKDADAEVIKSVLSTLSTPESTNDLSQDELERRYEAHRRKMQSLLGPLPKADSEVRKRDYSIIGGTVDVEGTEVVLNQFSSRRPTVVLQAIIGWLETEGATDIRFCIFDQNMVFDLPE